MAHATEAPFYSPALKMHPASVFLPLYCSFHWPALGFVSPVGSKGTGWLGSVCVIYRSSCREQVCVFSARQALSLLLGRYLGTEWLGGVVGLCLTLQKTVKPFSLIGSHILASHVFDSLLQV